MRKNNRPLYVGLVIFALGAMGFVGLSTQLTHPTTLEADPAIVQSGLSAMEEFDRKVALQMREFTKKETNVGYGMIGLTIIGGVPAMVLLSVAGLAWSLWRREPILALAWVVITAGGGILNFTLKTVIGRDRPPQDWRDPFATERNQSFPSGHAMGSAIGLGVLAYTFWLQLPGKRRRWAIAGGLALVVIGVGLSRVYLRAHWFSDVMAGFLIGSAWLALGVGIFETIRLKYGETTPEEQKEGKTATTEEKLGPPGFEPGTKGL